MLALAEEHARRAVKLRHNHALGTVDDKRTLVGHIRNSAKVHVLHLGSKVLMVRVGTVEFEFCLQRHVIGKATVETLFDGVTRWIDVIVKEFKNKVIASVRNGEILAEHFIESLVFSFLSRSI